MTTIFKMEELRDGTLHVDVYGSVDRIRKMLIIGMCRDQNIREVVRAAGAFSETKDFEEIKAQIAKQGNLDLDMELKQELTDL